MMVTVVVIAAASITCVQHFGWWGGHVAPTNFEPCGSCWVRADAYFCYLPDELPDGGRGSDDL